MEKDQDSEKEISQNTYKIKLIRVIKINKYK